MSAEKSIKGLEEALKKLDEEFKNQYGVLDIADLEFEAFKNWNTARKAVYSNFREGKPGQ